MNNKTTNFNFNNILSPLQLENSLLNEQEFSSGTSKLASYPRRIFIMLDNYNDSKGKADGITETFNTKLLRFLSPSMKFAEELVLVTENAVELTGNMQPALEFADEFNINKTVLADVAILGELSPWIFQYSVTKVNIIIDPPGDFTEGINNVIPSVRDLVVRKYFAHVKPVVNLVYLLSKTDATYIPDMLRLPFETEADEISLVFKKATDSCDNNLNADKLTYLREQLKIKSNYYGIRCKMPYSINSPIIQYSAWSDLFINYNGGIKQSFKGKNITPRSLYPDTSFIDDIWNSPELITLRNTALSEENKVSPVNQYNHIF